VSIRHASPPTEPLPTPIEQFLILSPIGVFAPKIAFPTDKAFHDDDPELFVKSFLYCVQVD